MESISWSIQLGPKTFFRRLNNPWKIIRICFLLGLIVCLVYILAAGTNHYLHIPVKTTFSIGLLLVITFFISTLIYSRDIFRQEVRQFVITDQGVSVNGSAHPWSDYTFFQDDFKVIRNTKKYIPPELDEKNPDLFVIQLLQKEYQGKKRLPLYIEKKEIYEKVRVILLQKLKESFVTL